MYLLLEPWVALPNLSSDLDTDAKSAHTFLCPPRKLLAGFPDEMSNPANGESRNVGLIGTGGITGGGGGWLVDRLADGLINGLGDGLIDGLGSALIDGLWEILIDGLWGMFG